MDQIREINLSLRPTRLELRSFPVQSMQIDPFWMELLENKQIEK